MDKQQSFEDSSAVMMNQSPTSSTAVMHTPASASSTTTAPEAAAAPLPLAHQKTISSSIHSEKASKKPRKISAKEGFMTIVKSSWVNVLLVFVPIGIASHFVWSPTITFIMNFLAIIPLAKLLGFATEDIALRTGEVSDPHDRSRSNAQCLPIDHWWPTQRNVWKRSRTYHFSHLPDAKFSRCCSGVHVGVHFVQLALGAGNVLLGRGISLSDSIL